MLALVGIYVVFFFAQTDLIFSGDRNLKGDPSGLHWAFEEVTLPVLGQTTHGWFIPLEGARGVVLFSHGNGGNISTHLGPVASLRKLGFSVLTYDYGGYGQSSGRPSEQRVYADAMAM